MLKWPLPSVKPSLRVNPEQTRLMATGSGGGLPSSSRTFPVMKNTRGPGISMLGLFGLRPGSVIPGVGLLPPPGEGEDGGGMEAPPPFVCPPAKPQKRRQEIPHRNIEAFTRARLPRQCDYTLRRRLQACRLRSSTGELSGSRSPTPRLCRETCDAARPPQYSLPAQPSVSTHA